MYNMYNSATVTCKCINGIPHEDFGISLQKDYAFHPRHYFKSNMEDPLFIVVVGMMLLTVTICTTTFK